MMICEAIWRRLINPCARYHLVVKRCPSIRIHLTHWGRVTHICVGKLISIGSDNGLSPERRRQAITWTNAGILLIGPLGTNFSENLIEIQTFSLKKIRLKMLSAKCRPFCLGLNVLIWSQCSIYITIQMYALRYLINSTKLLNKMLTEVWFCCRMSIHA